jgi:hypothetical protein
VELRQQWEQVVAAVEKVLSTADHQQQHHQTMEAAVAAVYTVTEESRREVLSQVGAPE